MRTLLKDVSKNKEKWLEVRRGKCGSSQAYDACFRPVKAWLNISGREEVEQTDPMYFGQLFEPLLGPEFVRRWNNKNPKAPAELVHVDDCYQHADRDWQIFTPDFFVNIGGDIWDLSIKTTGFWAGKSFEDGVSDYAHCQSAHALEVMPELKGSIVFALIGGQSCDYHVLPRDSELGATITDRETQLMSYVESDTPPPLESANLDEISALFPSSNGEAVMLPPDAFGLLQEYNAVKGEISALDENRKELEAKIKQMLGENEAGEVGNMKVTWKTVESNRFDSTAFKNAHPHTYEQFLKTSSYRRFTVGEKKNGKK